MTEDREDVEATADRIALANAEDRVLLAEAPVIASSVSPDLSDEPAAARTFVYAVGRVEPRYPRLDVEKEFAQVAGRDGAIGLTDQQALHSLLRERSNRYLARELCWVLSIEGLETYILHPRDPADFDLLIEAVRPLSRATDVDVVVGALGPIAAPEVCNALMVPIVGFDQLYSFDVDSLIKSIPRPSGMKAEQFEPVAEELFMRIAHIADNAGATDEDRALNYLSVRYPAIYHAAAEHIAAGSTLSSVEVRPSRLSGVRSVVDVVFAYTHRATDVTEKEFVRVDVTEEFPFLVTKLSSYFDRDT
jgi:hypothetical protein